MGERYDSNEARELLGLAAGESDELRAKRQESARELLAELARLNNVVAGFGVLPVPSTTNLFLVLGEKSVYFGWDSGGFKLWRQDEGEADLRRERVPLRYNASWNLFESEQDDPFYVPTPGEPRRKRAALAVIIEAALRFMSASPVTK
jgi:hypothetical protein